MRLSEYSRRSEIRFVVGQGECAAATRWSFLRTKRTDAVSDVIREIVGHLRLRAPEYGHTASERARTHGRR